MFVLYEVCFVPGCVKHEKQLFIGFMCVLGLSRVCVFSEFSASPLDVLLCAPRRRSPTSSRDNIKRAVQSEQHRRPSLARWNDGRVAVAKPPPHPLQPIIGQIGQPISGGNCSQEAVEVEYSSLPQIPLARQPLVNRIENPLAQQPWVNRIVGSWIANTATCRLPLRSAMPPGRSWARSWTWASWPCSSPPPPPQPCLAASSSSSEASSSDSSLAIAETAAAAAE